MVQTMISKKFRPYDYGAVKNLQIYKATEPPEYPLHKITSTIYLYEGEFDILFSRKVKLFRNLISNNTLKFYFNLGC
jgi:hypothetical protein